MKKNGKFLLFFLFLTIFFNGCNNFFHDLLPPSNNEIISFAVQFPDGSRSATSNEIKNQTVTVTVPDGTDLTNLIPVVTVSEKATVIPGTLPYLNKVFPDRDLMHLAVEMYDAFNNGTFQDWFLKFVMESPKVSIPPLDMPVDFSVPVYFCVISGDGKYQLYTVTVLTETEKKIEDTGIIPPGADNFILSFEVPEQKGVAEIIHEPIGKASYGTVDFIISQDANIRSLLPTITVSEGARIIPLTMAYIMDCGFSYEQMLGFYTGYSTATDLEKYVTTFLRRATNIVYPEITMPIDFSEAVPFAVVGSDGGVRVYNANCSVYDGTPKLENVYFSKANNPYLIKDFECEISSNNFTGKATYPDEMELDYNLIPDIVFIGEKATYSINGGAETEIISGVTVIPFTSEDRTCTITVYREGNTKTYNLTIDKFIDPDTIRSITDYRFKKINNNIKNTVIASIYNEGDTGFISAKILYEGSIAPYDLVADFISPGIVTTADTMQGAVPGTVQSSGVTSNNFQYSRKFLCTSRNGLYSRLYTVNIEFIQVIPAEVAIKTFTFPVYLNSDLSQDSVAIINDADGSIRCQVTYASETVPKTLVPEFSATGAVSCSGITQTSGYTANNFTYSQYYKVTVEDEFYGTLTKNYRVEVVFKQDNASACELLTFGFATEDNPSLTNDVTATITQRNGSIYGFMPFGAGATEGNALVPFFTAEGTVSVNGETQTSGASSQDFSSPVTYTVTSANGRYTKDYTVTLQERGAVIYVDCEAYGLNNGTSWQDAFISLDKALEQAALMPAGSAAEIWVTAPENKTYVSTEETGFKLHKEGSITILGGFDGTEQNASERQFDEKGNLLKRTNVTCNSTNQNALFHTNSTLKDYVYLEGIETSQKFGNFFYDYVGTFDKSTIIINDCDFSLTAGLTYCNTNSYDVKITNSKFDKLSSRQSGRSFNVENCVVNFPSSDGAVNLSGYDIKFNNNTIAGVYADITLDSDGKLEFENNTLLKTDDVVIVRRGTTEEIDKPILNLHLEGEGNLSFTDMAIISFHTYYSPFLNIEFNNCEFAEYDFLRDSSNAFVKYDNGVSFSGGSITVNDSVFSSQDILIGESANLELNGCDFFDTFLLGARRISNSGTLTINNSNINLNYLGNGNTCLTSSGSLFINGGTFNFTYEKGIYSSPRGHLIEARGNLSINGGTFNFEHAGSGRAFYVGCGATISDAKFNFTGDEYTSDYCAYFWGGTNGSTIKNCEFTIDKCAKGGFYNAQAGLKIENSKFDINLHEEEINSKLSCGFYCYSETSFNDCEIICEDSYYGFYSCICLNLIDCKTCLKKCKNMGIQFKGNLYINGGKLDIFESSNQGIYSGWANGSSLLIENCNVSLSDQLQTGILFGYMENGLISINNSFIGTNTRINFEMGGNNTGTTIIKDSILNCRYITSTSSTWPVIISNTSGVW